MRVNIKKPILERFQEFRRVWFKRFIIRNPELGLRTLESTNSSRSIIFNKKNVTESFENARKIREKYKFEHQNISTCDETEYTTVQACPKVIATCSSSSPSNFS